MSLKLGRPLGVVNLGVVNLGAVNLGAVNLDARLAAAL
jgi:hypothetical protein